MSGPVRPSGYIGWASATGATNVAEPTDAQKGIGWAVGQPPPSSYENWLEQKRDRWIQYLSWRTDLRPVVIDDFASPAGNNGATLMPFWFANAPSGSFFKWTPADSYPLQTARAFGAGGTGYAELLADVGYLGTRDFRMDHIVQLSQANASTGVVFELGLMYQHSGSSGGDVQMGWLATGNSGLVSACWWPSGAAQATSLSFTALDLKMHKYTIESRSPTMAFYIDDSLVGAAPTTVVGGPNPNPLAFGTRFGGASGGQFVLVDYVELSTRRAPT